MIEFDGQLDEKLYRRVLYRQMRGALGWAVVMLLAFVFVLATGRAESLIGWPLLLPALAVYVLFAPYLAVRRGMKTGAMIAAPFHGSVDETHFVTESEFGRADIPWPKFFRVQTGPDYVMLFSSAHQFFIIARRYFANETDWAAFRNLATANVKALKRGRSFLKTAILWLVIIVVVFVIWTFTRPR